MAEKSVSVRLSASVTPYIKAMDEARAATKKLESESSMNMSRLSKGMTDVGKKMTMGVTLPIVGAGAAAVKMSMSFDTAFSQMVGLAGIPAGEVDDLKKSVLDLAGETARAPQELAEALYFAASAGLDSAGAMDAVRISARGAAAGMGTTGDIVGLVASAVASYGAENITAAEATDILTSTIREGRADPDELAASLGRVLPVAASLGVEFGEVGGTVAYLSNVFGDTDRTVTAVNDTFAKLAAPTEGAKVALLAAGTSAEELKRTIGEDGLLAGLDLLRERGFKGNAEAIRAIMPDMQGATALTALLDDASGSLADTLGKTSNATGSLDEALAAMDPEVQAMKQSWVDVQVAMVQVGAIIGPIIADVASKVGDLAGWFTELDPTMQKIIVGVAALAAAAGPLLIVTGSLIRNYQTLHKSMSTIGTSSSPKMTAAIGVAGVVLAAYAIHAKRAAESNDRMNESFEDLSTVTDDMVIRTFRSALIQAAIAGKGLEESMAELAETNMIGARRLLDVMEASEGMGEETELLRTAILGAEDAAARGEQAQEKYSGTLSESASASMTAAERAKALSDSYGAAAYEAAYLAQGNSAVATSNDDAAKATELNKKVQQNILAVHDAVTEALAEQIAMLEKQIDAHRSAADATYALHDAEDEFTDVVDGLTDALADNEDGVRGVQQIYDTLKQTAQGVADAQLRVAEETATATGKTISATAKIDIMNQSLLDQAANLNGPERQALVQHIALVNGIPEERATEILALIDEGKVEEADALIEELSRTRDLAINVSTDTTNADSMIQTWLNRQRTMNVDVKMTSKAMDSGGFGLPGDLVGERRPEFVNGQLITSPMRLTSPAYVTGGADTARLLSGAKMTPGAQHGTMTQQGGDQSRRVTFGDTYVTARADVDAMFARANAALALI